MTIDDIDLDSFSWNNQSLPSNSDGDDPNKEVAVCKVIVPSSSGGASISMREERVVRRRATGRSRLSNIGFEELRNYFYMPITKAAKEMNVGLTVLKKRCRELGIPRWPHRKMKSLSSLIHNVQVYHYYYYFIIYINLRISIYNIQQHFSQKKKKSTTPFSFISKNKLSHSPL